MQTCLHQGSPRAAQVAFCNPVSRYLPEAVALPEADARGRAKVAVRRRVGKKRGPKGGGAGLNQPCRNDGRGGTVEDREILARVAGAMH